MPPAALQSANMRTELHPELPDLVARSKAGDSLAFEKIFRMHQGRIYALCLRMTADPDKAESLTQDAFVRGWQKLESYQGKGSFSGWMHRVAVNTVIEFSRIETRQRKRFRPLGSENEVDSAQHEDDAESRIDLERALASLPAGARQAFVLHDVEGFRHREIAEMTGLAVGTLKAQLHRARKLLMDRLDAPEGRGKHETR